ncbi:MAG: hypothetical protein E6K17_00545 [Methanobacteriota archaeon]|nr:MAG: hypothetical protein E6K17_00545 [Euryarchaeota archaeon]
MREILVRAFPLALFAALSEWIVIDLVRYAPLEGWGIGGLALAVAAFASLRGSWRGQPHWHRASRAILATTFVGERLVVAGGGVVPMIGLLVLLMALAALQSLERMFAPVFDAAQEPGLRSKVDAAAIAAYARAFALMGFTFAASLLLVQLLPLLALQGRSLVLALGTALALLAIIAWLAVSPARPSRKRA